MNVAKSIDTIYNEREQFILIGLTGRTGSGCTTVSRILESETFSDLSMHEPKTTDFVSNDERKYQIIYTYAEKHWTPFYRISMTDMIFSFILQYDYDTFLQELKNLFGNIIVEDIEKTITNKYTSLKAEFNHIHQSILGCLTENNNLIREYTNDFNKEYEILIKLPSVQTKFREIMINHNFNFKNEHEETMKANLFTYCLQEFGNRIRHHGNILKDNNFTGEHMFAIARRANGFIKAVPVCRKTR